MKKNKGFTLIEIIVSLMIASIGMLIATTLILNSMGYFNKTAVSDNDKQVLDSIKDYVHNELLYASNVKIQTEYPKKEDGTLDSEWHYLFVKDHQLYRDSNCESDFTKAVPVYGSDFYTNGRKLFVEARGFNNYRIDFKFYLTDRNGTESNFDSSYEYKTSTTVEMLNMKEYVSNKGGTGLFEQAQLESLSDETDKKLKVFYKKGDLPMSEQGQDPSDSYIGFVSDQMECKNESNVYNGDGKLELNKSYKVGTFVYVLDENNKKVWYRCLKDNAHVSNFGEVTADSSYRWKKIDAYYHEYSPYLKGDRVIYVVENKERYFECIKDTLNLGTVITPFGSWNSDTYWKEIKKPTESNKRCDIPGLVEYKSIVATKPEDKNIKREEISEYSANEFYGQEAFVKYNGAVWLTLEQVNKNVKPGDKDNKGNYIWQKIQLTWNETSGYNPNDIIFYEGDFYRVKAGQSFREGTKPASYINTNWVANEGWEKVYFKSDGSWSTSQW